MTWRMILGMTLAAYALPLQANVLNYPQALSKAEAQNRPLKAAEDDIQMQMAEAWQAGLMINPLLTFEIDDFAGTSFYRGFKHTEYSVSLTQPIELGGKREARQNVALAAVYKSYWSYQALKQRIFRELEEAFIAAASLQEHIKILSEQQMIAQDSSACASEKAASGKIPAFQKNRALIACRSSELAFEKAKSDASAALSAISVLIGEACSTFNAVHYPFFKIAPPLPFCAYEENLENNPELASARVDVFAANQVYQLERANRIPDLDVTASAANYHEENDTAFSIQFSIPLPIFNQNQGSICRSSWQTHQANHIQEDLAINLHMRLRAAYQKLTQAYAEVHSLQGEIQKCAKETIEAAQESYKQGKIELFELLDAHRTCNEIHGQYIEALKEYHLRRIEVET